MVFNQDLNAGLFLCPDYSREAANMSHIRICSDCESGSPVSRREFIRTAGVAAAAVGAAPLLARADVSLSADSPPETVAKLLFESLSDAQKKEICFAWDFTEPERGLLRTRMSNNWNITKPNITSEFYNKDQQAMIKHIFEGIIQPEWHERIYKQLEDDAGGYGEAAEHRHVRRSRATSSSS